MSDSREDEGLVSDAPSPQPQSSDVDLTEPSEHDTEAEGNEEATSNIVTNDTAPIPIQDKPDVPLLYDERLHIKFMFTFYHGPMRLLMWLVFGLIMTPVILAIYNQLDAEWSKLEAFPVIGIIARTIRIIIFTIVDALLGALVSVFTATGAVGATLAWAGAIVLSLIVVVLFARPIYAWRVSRVQVGQDRAFLLRPGSKILFLNDHSIRIKDTRIIRGVSDQTLAFDRWVFPGAGIVTIDKDDLGGYGDDEPWAPVRKTDKLVEAVEAVIATRKSQSKYS